MYVPVYGDAATIDTTSKSKRARALSTQEERNFRCMAEVGQEFHKEGLLLGVIIVAFSYIDQIPLMAHPPLFLLDRSRTFCTYS